MLRQVAAWGRSGWRPFAVDDIDAVYRRIRAAGFEFIYPLTDEPWGISRLPRP